jgi:hypothetical protein
MKASELRIGNLVMRYSNIMEILGRGNDSADLILLQPNTRVNWRMLYSDIFGIPLTEEWLLKFGFELDHTNQSWHHRTFVLGEFEMEELVGEYGYNQTKLQYVHQLQNLYFALTGEELTIKEPAV